MKVKYLRLDANYPECHGLARALVGSPISNSFDDLYKDWILLGMWNDRFVFTSSRFTPKSHYAIEIPLETLKLCPFAAMREGVSVFCPKTEQCGDIDSIIARNEIWLQNDGDCDISPIHLKAIRLDLENLPRGAEIVEL